MLFSVNRCARYISLAYCVTFDMFKMYLLYVNNFVIVHVEC